MSKGIYPDTVIGQYTVVAKIGEGGMGEVYRARDMKLGRDVAIKVLPAAFSEDSERLRRFEQEAQAAASLNHPNILVIFHIGMQKARRTSSRNCLKARRCANVWLAARCPNEKRSTMRCKPPAVWRRRTGKESFIAT